MITHLFKLGPSFLPLGGSSGPAALSGRRPSRLRLDRTSVAKAVVQSGSVPLLWSGSERRTVGGG